jgi:hypothetical protein
MNTIFLLNKNFIPNDTLISKIQDTARNLRLNFEKIEEERVDVYVPDFGDLLEIGLQGTEGFKRTFAEQNYKKGYGTVLYIDYNNGGKREDRTVIPFLKEFLKIFPEILVYNDEIPPSGTALIFTKDQIEAFKDNECVNLFRNNEN